MTFFWSLLSTHQCFKTTECRCERPVQLTVYEAFVLVLYNLQWLSLFQFVVAAKACPVHTSIHSVELWRESAANQAIGITKLT